MTKKCKHKWIPVTTGLVTSRKCKKCKVIENVIVPKADNKKSEIIIHNPIVPDSEKNIKTTFDKWMKNPKIKEAYENEKENEC